MENESQISLLRKEIFGHFYTFAKWTGQINPPRKGLSKKAKVVYFLPTLISLVLLINRAVYMMFFTKNKSWVLSFDWCYAMCLSFLSLHALVSCIILMIFKYKNVIDTFLDILLKATRNKIPKITKGITIQCASFVIFYAGSSVVYCVENVIMYKNYEDNGTIRDTAVFRKSIFGTQALFGLDILIIMWGALISIVALLFYLLLNNALVVSYKQFNCELKKNLEHANIKGVDMLLDVENQITDFLKAFLYFNKTLSGLCIVSFSAGLLINISAQYGQRAFGDSEMNALQQTLFVLWLISSIQLMAIATIKASEFYTCLNKTQDMLCLEKSFHADSSLREITTGITDAIEKVIGSSKIIGSGKSTFFIFNLILMFVPVFADIMTALLNSKSKS